MNKLKLLFIIAGVSALVIAVFLIADALVEINKTTEEIRLIKGEISVFEYCAYIGKAAVDDSKCKDFNRFFG